MRHAPSAHRLFFPAAVLFALAAIPAWVLEYAGILPPARGGGFVAWHGHEMVFGYALAVIAGYLLTRISGNALVAVFALWLAGRIDYLLLPLPPLAEAAIAVSFPLCLFVFAGTPFLRAAKTWRNSIFAAILAGLVLAALAYQSGALGALAAGEARGVGLGINVVTLLMFTMGGRIIAAATSGALQDRGIRLHGVAHPDLETAGVAAIAVLAATDFWGRAAAVAAAAALAAALTVVLRLYRWQVWKVAAHPEMLALHVGYAWLAIGLAAQGAALAFGVPAPVDALHGVTVGALGSLSLAIMARVSLQRSARPIVFPPYVTLAIAMISGAAICRLLAAIPFLRIVLIEAASLLGLLAFALFAIFLFRLRRPAR